MAPLDLTLSHLERSDRQIQGHAGFKALYHEKEPVSPYVTIHINSKPYTGIWGVQRHHHI